MQRLEVSVAVRLICMSLGFKRLSTEGCKGRVVDLENNGKGLLRLEMTLPAVKVFSPVIMTPTSPAIFFMAVLMQGHLESGFAVGAKTWLPTWTVGYASYLVEFL